MRLSIGFMLLVAGAVLVSGPATAEAAKGTKKKDHKVEGTVVAVRHHKKSKHAVLIVKVHHHKKKGQTATSATAAGSTASEKGAHHHSLRAFEVSAKTKIESANGKGEKSSGLAALHKGEQVTIEAKGHHAMEVVIHQHQHRAKPTVN